MDTEAIFCEDCDCQISTENLCEHYVILENDAEVSTEASASTSNVTFAEQLISFIQDAPALWDSCLPISERSNTIKEKLWLEIYHAFNGKYTIKTLQAKWKNIRDTFIKAKGEMESYIPSGSGTKPTKKPWKFYDSIAPRATTSNIKVATLTTSNESCSVETPGVSEASKHKPNVDEAFLGAIEKLSTPPIQHIDSTCIRLSEMLSTLPPRKKQSLKLLKSLKNSKLMRSNKIQ